MAGPSAPSRPYVSRGQVLQRYLYVAPMSAVGANFSSPPLTASTLFNAVSPPKRSPRPIPQDVRVVREVTRRCGPGGLGGRQSELAESTTFEVPSVGVAGDENKTAGGNMWLLVNVIGRKIDFALPGTMRGALISFES
ncbi:hypothetical protein CIHG_02305 [Coccidioides immitis H538.4]|uniref:Uncharacterized protein n=1 Tax=Coccidioides immitis H538.4 TaxID=396776 RepID=A0A0J8RIN3_COCIT|nr:hypothetical protein CIHG_02305 [Coccidioides immitis H538.4]